MPEKLVYKEYTYKPTHEILQHLRDNSRSHVVLAVSVDPDIRHSVMNVIAEQLNSKYKFYDFDYLYTDQTSLPRFCRSIQDDPSICISAFGLEKLKNSDYQKYSDALHFLNTHREDIRDSKSSVIIWLNPETITDLLQLSPDFRDWSVTVRFDLPEDIDELRNQAERFEEMLSRPNLDATLTKEFEKQLVQIRKRLSKSRDLKEINVFIASPGDVQAERRIIRDTLKILNKRELIGFYGIRFKTVGWEDVFPCAGRPQEIINRLVKDCDIFVCLFHKRFGAPTGKESSGTLEEFIQAYDSWKSWNTPHIMFYFKEASVNTLEEMKDEQLLKVMELKDKIVQEKLLLYKEFKTIDDFKEHFSKDIEGWIVKNAEKVRDVEKSIVKGSMPVITEMPDLYIEWVLDRCSSMDIDKLREKGNVIQVSLPELFIPLYANITKSIKISNLKKNTEDIFVEWSKGLIPVFKNIELLVGENEYLLIEGDPGSGKTTLLKHLSCCLVKRAVIKGLEGYLPVLIFLKDLRKYFDNAKDIKPVASSVYEILSFYFDHTENGLSVDTVKAFCAKNRVIFMLDGLDEMWPTDRDKLVESFADFRLKNKGCKIVFSSRPHGLDGAAVNRFGEGHIKISPLRIEQVEEFVKKWFSIVYSEGSKVGNIDAKGMLSEIRAHHAIERLIENPLMLTAICILYHDGKELPGQRAELYKKFVENMLYRRFDQYEMVYEFLMTLAFKMHSDRAKGIDQVSAVSILKEVNQKCSRTIDSNFSVNALFDEIEPKCGLLILSDGQYSFRHLSFQEFLTARYIMTNETDYEAAIEKYWNNDWYREVIELYIGYLSIENKGWANRIIKNKLESKDEFPFKESLLAANSIIDLHKDRRDIEIIDAARKRLKMIIDESIVPKIGAEAGEILGWVGDDRNDLKDFVRIEDGEYKTNTGKAYLKDFEIGKYPVINSWFAEFVTANGYENIDFWSNEGRKWLEYKNVKHPLYWNEREWKCPNAPVVGISWYEAYAFTRWLSITRQDSYEYHLPEENEWEAVAAGKDGLRYPWGNEWDNNHCNNEEAGLKKISSVGIFKKGKTSYNVFDMSGNVWEWTTSDYYSKKILKDFKLYEELQKLCIDHKYNRIREKLKNVNLHLPVLRGGSWGNDKFNSKCFTREGMVSFAKMNGVGFRCARTLKP